MESLSNVPLNLPQEATTTTQATVTAARTLPACHRTPENIIINPTNLPPNLDFQRSLPVSPSFSASTQNLNHVVMRESNETARAQIPTCLNYQNTTNQTTCTTLLLDDTPPSYRSKISASQARVGDLTPESNNLETSQQPTCILVVPCTGSCGLINNENSPKSIDSLNHVDVSASNP